MTLSHTSPLPPYTTTLFRLSSPDSPLSASYSSVKFAWVPTPTVGSDRPDTTPWRIGDCYMGHVQDLVEILATLLIIIFIITHHHAMMSLKQSLRNILGVHVHHVYSCGYPNT